MISAILHLIAGVIMILGALFVYYRLYIKKEASQTLKRIFYFFLSFVGYNLSLSLPFFLSANLKIVSLGYNLSLIFLFIACIPWLKNISDIFNLSNKRRNILSFLFLIIGLAMIAILTIDLRIPTIDPSGFIIWNKNVVAAWIIAILISLVPGGLALTIFKNWPTELNPQEKIKTTTLFLGSLLYLLACIYFIPATLITTILAFIFFITASIVFTIPFLIPKSTNSSINTQ